MLVVINVVHDWMNPPINAYDALFLPIRDLDV